VPSLAKTRIRSDGQGHFRLITELPGHGTVTQARKIFLGCARACSKRDQETIQTPPTPPTEPAHTLQPPFATIGRARKLPYTGSTLGLRVVCGPIIAKSSLPLFRSTPPSTWVHPPSPLAALLYPFAPSRSYALFTPPMSDHPSLTSQASLDTLNSPPPRKWVNEVWIHITRHVGVGLICSVAYFDPCVSFLAAFPFVRAHP
jgi:hypothetical protein